MSGCLPCIFLSPLCPHPSLVISPNASPCRRAWRPLLDPQRKKFAEKAKKDGEADTEERYSLPNLYVSGAPKVSHTPHTRSLRSIGLLRPPTSPPAAQSINTQPSIRSFPLCRQSPHQKAFNAIQRAFHAQREQALEFYFCSLAAALSFPLTAAFFVFMYVNIRRLWTKGYMEGAETGDLGKRYSYPLTRNVWTFYIALILLALLSAVNIVRPVF